MSEYVKENKKLQPKDFVTIGIFSAIFIFITMGVGMLTAIPVFIPLITVIIPVVAGIPFMLFLTKVKKFGMVSITGLITGILTMVGGMGIWPAILGISAAVAADLILLSARYTSKVRSVIASGVYWTFLIGTMGPIIVTRDSYYQNLLSQGMDQAYLDGLTKWVPDWSLIPLLIACFVGGILGGLLGLATLKKHFEKAGIVG